MSGESVKLVRSPAHPQCLNTYEMTKIRHFTATGIVAYKNASLVHWHRKVGEWLAPGGHIEPNEDPVQAMLREGLEETGMHLTILPTSPLPQISNLQQVTPPYTIMIEDVVDKEHGPHQHIDLIYFTTPAEFEKGADGYPVVPSGWVWMSKEELETGKELKSPDGRYLAPPEDVIKLSLIAIELLNSKSVPAK